MKFAILLLVLIGCTSTSEIKSSTPVVTGAVEKPKRFPKSLPRAYFYDVKQEDELSRATTLRIKKDGTFTANLRSLSNDTRSYDISDFNGTWTYAENTLTLVTDQASCRYTYGNSKEPSLAARPTKSLTRKVIEGDERSVEFCRYIFNPCKKGQCF